MDILVPLSGDEGSWDSLAQAILVAQREGARLHGLHVVGSDDALAAPAALAIQARFHEECAAAGADGKLAIEAGHVTAKIRERAPMADLIVLKVAHPPAGGWGALRSPFHSIVRQASRPVLGVPAAASRLGRALLAYDGSELSREALFVAAYLAEVWKSELLVFTALEGSKVRADAQDYVRRYLDLHEVPAEYVVSEQDARQALMRAADEWRADLVLMGSHGPGLVRHALIGSALDYMLRESAVPLFICR
jgi:nucleotide-binding universal stress UspA family protein